MLVYHGSNLIVNEPKIIIQNRTLDFGKGFYVTLNKEQSEVFSKKVFKYNYNNIPKNLNAPVVNVFEVDEQKFSNLNKIKFDGASYEWMDFVCENRIGIYSGTEYDAVEGPIANDDVYSTFQLYERKVINKQEAIERLKIKKLFNQVALKNEKALSCIKFVSSYEVN